MTQKEKIKEYIKKHFPFVTNSEIQDIRIIEDITNSLELEELINFSFNETMYTAENEYWIQCEYISKIGKAIIYDYEVVENNWNTIDKFIDNLIKYHKEIKELENKIIFTQN